ncbi:hypothetical protein [Maribellus maritimus]|uniref:hypothetical protein n=1 Tax=Maribellus maritimus TaxID=2870838 RepID=UPI001EEC7069|nr:hypothetical protein [Maribellus maritimus]MCG6186184.1 hypothetical protein [Maribellus maritimus]
MKKTVIIISLLFCVSTILSQPIQIKKSLIRSFKPDFTSAPQRIDLDNDGDPDLIKSTVFDTIPVFWIDDDDDMQPSDWEGDLDSDCLIIDRNNDGIFAGPGDISLDWVDNNSDGVADMQVVVENSNPHIKNYWEWSSNYMWIIDPEQDETFNYVNWKEMVLRCWEHYGAANFYEDYHGQTLFQKAHVHSYRFSDLRYSWENPFLFYDIDDDGLTEMAIRLEDSCEFKKENEDDEIDTYPTGKIDHVYMSFDLDNDNGPSNEFDFDLSIRFNGEGFSYTEQIHQFDKMRGLPAADLLFYDVRWRKMNELVYTDHDSAWNKVYNEGIWEQCWFTFDEDDDCERWERVEFYQPGNPFKIGMQKGGIDNNPQADATGDRGEWDTDNSGQGKLYIGFDNRIHLYGAENGYWRIDQDADSYQGWGGLYAGQYKRDQKIPEKFATVGYEDTNNDGFLDFVKYDLNGDTIFEKSFNLNELGVKTSFEIYNPAEVKPENLNQLFEKAASQMWQQAELAIEAARVSNINYKWYAQLMHPKSLNEKYRFGYWLQFYIFTDLYNRAEETNNKQLRNKTLKAYFGQNWESFNK